MPVPRPVSRRQFLSYGSAGTAAVVAAPLVEAPAAALPGPELERRRFPGDPGRGRLYYGAHLPWPRSVSRWENTVLQRNLSVRRSYYAARNPRGLIENAREDHRHRRLPMVSIDPVDDWAAIGRGRQDRWIGQLMHGLARLRKPVFLTVHHEPENDAGGPGMSASDYNRMQRRLIRKARAMTDNVTVVPMLQHWTFDPRRRDTHPGAWTVEEARVFGVDCYNPWSPTNGLAWRSFGEKLNEVRRWTHGKPMAIGEYGCRRYGPHPERSRTWMLKAMRFARHHNVVAMSYFNSSVSRHESWVLNTERLQAFKHNLHRRAVARI